MSGKMDWFTEQAQKVMIYAQQEAERLQHSYIGTEHLLLGMMREKTCLAYKVLRQFDLEHYQVADLVEKLALSTKTAEKAPPVLSPGLKQVFEMAVVEARNLKHGFIGTEHLLLGLIRAKDGIAFDVLKRMSIDVDEVRRRVLRSFTSSQPPSSNVLVRAFQREVVRTLEETKILDEVHRTVQLNLYTKLLLQLLSDVAQTLNADEKRRMGEVIEKLFNTIMTEEKITMLHDEGRLRLLYPLIRPFLQSPD